MGDIGADPKRIEILPVRPVLPAREAPAREAPAAPRPEPVPSR